MSTALKLRPELAWPVKFSAQEARTLVNRRLKTRVPLKTTLYHHPFLGLVFQSGKPSPGIFPITSRWRQPPELIRAHVLVDLVGGRAYLSDSWDSKEFVAIRPTEQTSALQDPEPVVDETAAIRAARAILASMVQRSRKLSSITDLELLEPPIRLGKPNWWVTSEDANKSTEVIVDGITGKHYAFSV